MKLSKYQGVTLVLSFVLIVLFSLNSFAHYGMVIPSDSMVMQKEKKRVDLNLSFSHPFELIGMKLVKPKQ